MIVKKYQELRDKTLSELKESISNNRDILPGGFIKIWQDFEMENNQLQLKESKEWLKLGKLKDNLYSIKVSNIMALFFISVFVLLNLGLLNLYYQHRTESLEIINNLKDHHEE